VIFRAAFSAYRKGASVSRTRERNGKIRERAQGSSADHRYCECKKAPHLRGSLAVGEGGTLKRSIERCIESFQKILGAERVPPGRTGTGLKKKNFCFKERCISDSGEILCEIRIEEGGLGGEKGAEDQSSVVHRSSGRGNFGERRAGVVEEGVTEQFA